MPKERKPGPKVRSIWELRRDGACDDTQQQTIEDDSPLAWATKVAEDEAAGLD